MWLLSYMIFYICEHNRIFCPKIKHFLKKTAHAGQDFVRKYSYLKIKFCLCIRKIISKLLLMQEPTNDTPITTCLFQKIFQLSYVDTMAMVSHIWENLMDMHLKLPTFQHDIRKFNDWIQMEIGKHTS